MHLRRNFSSSGLVRLLGDFENAPPPGSAEPPAQDFAEKLSRWVGVFEAGTLHAAHQSVDAARPAPGRVSALKVSLNEQLHQVRSILARAIANSSGNGQPADAGARGGRLPVVQMAPVAEADIDFAPYRQRYQDQQRNMDLMIGPLRDNVRQVLSAASPELRQLAVLDAVWEKMLAAREQKLLQSVPVRLRRRFDSLRKAAQAAQTADFPDLLAEVPVVAAPSPLQPDGWLDVFGRELQQLLLAELDARLEPVTGLVEAFEFEQES